ncbi:MAG: hypothetical protein HC784_02450 [Hydrococcus sp. CSU_1_8]|nr:hypothetical protein [Hydrococcus sp. CSU_1_8]
MRGRENQLASGKFMHSMYNLCSFCQEQKLPVALPSNSPKITLQFYQQGLSIEEIAQTRGLAVSTIYQHITELFETNQPVKINDFVIPVKQEQIVNAIQKVGADSLKPIKEYLGESFSYEEIRLVRAWWRKENE